MREKQKSLAKFQGVMLHLIQAELNVKFILKASLRK